MLNFKKVILAFSALIAFTNNAALATDFKFADVETGIKILTADDEYLTAMKPIEIALRVGSPTADKTIDDLKAHYAANVIPWPEAEKALLKALIVTHKKKLAKIAHLLPDEVYFIKVTDEIEGGVPHTRGNAFISPARRTSLSTKLFFHQIFHIISRHNRVKRASLYKLINFRPCYFQPTEDVDKYSVRNPEAPFTEFFVPVEIDDRDTYVMTHLHTTHDGFDASIERGFDGHISADLLEVTVDKGICKPVIKADGSPSIYKHEDVPDFYEQVGHNTNFDYHPEEIIADNFAFLMMRKRDLIDPDIPRDIEDWLDIDIRSR
ncbi:hypothetical protein [Pseudemcibacter aquimaris]|uniref:hypothetical protein n=1 Tax=Pseudemcibacter aquimaris TaxID=2857064 RepID=UPI002012A0B9|nr:hypothetical protein [Pseudemcibacter aquimaris]MCC3862241.1 hypothetical protein [Pseudemcibacter aquimaris]WDU58993.1 hypothetical protein KW060_01735 [Pseudemcibacter aquimaris]